MKHKAILLLMAAISIAGIGVTSFLAYHHYFGSNICTVSERFSCDVVNKSSYSEFFGIPVAIMGMAYFVFVISATAFVKNDKNVFLYVLYVSLPSIAFSLYLTYVELFILGAICVFCESAKVLIISIILISALELRRRKVPLFKGMPL